MKNRTNEIVGGGMPVDIKSRILAIRGVQVMLDRDLAELYEVPTGALNQAVKRNAKRFPERFVFQLSEKEFANWKSQIVISNSERMGLRKRPYAFTEHGITIASTKGSQSRIPTTSTTASSSSTTLSSTTSVRR